MSKAREIQKQVTRPTSVALMLVLFQGFQLAFPDTMNKQWQDFTYNAITVLGATGIIDKLYRNRKIYINFIKNLFTKKEKSWQKN